MFQRRRIAGAVVVVALAAFGAGGSRAALGTDDGPGPSSGPGGPDRTGTPGPTPPPARLLAGAAKANVTPFTVIPGVTNEIDPHSNPGASNPDALDPQLWDASQVTATGVWGEPFVDANRNGRYDSGEAFTDDAMNTRLDPGTANRWTGVYMAGFDNDRIARGVFDPVWARALYLADPAGPAIAQVSVDFIGRFSDWDDRIVARVHALDPSVRLDALVAGATHDHESVDTVGLWGPDEFSDGTYPRYLRYVEEKVARTVVAAAQASRPAVFRFGTIRPGTTFSTVNGNQEDLAGLQSRNSCRTPWVLDDELRAMQVVAPGSGTSGGDTTIATILNWGTHVESMEDDNVFMSSDYVNTARATVESALGGVALWIPGAQGAVEIVGDSCRGRWRRDTFDGERYPVDSGGTPDVLRHTKDDPIATRSRTYAIGRVVGSAALAALRSRPYDATATAITGFTHQTVDVPVNNQGLAGLSAAGVIDKPAYIGGVSAGRMSQDITGAQTTPLSGVDARTAIYAWKVGAADFLTAPGELFPELYWGVSSHSRMVPGSAAEHYDVVRPNPDAIACASRPFSYNPPYGADTGRPFEPGIRELQERQGTAFHFLLGYTPDLLGYIVPGYDFAWYAVPAAHGVGLGALHGAVDGWRDEAPDPCRSLPPDLAFPGVGYGTHYHETNSAGSMLAPGYTCTAWRMLHRDPSTSAERDGACRDWDAWRNARVAHAAVDDRPVCDESSDTDCVRNE